MKKILTVLTIVALVATSAFAGIKGSAELGYTHNFETKDSGFSNGTNLKLDLELATASEEKQAEGDIYAKISGSLVVKFYNGAKGWDSVGVNEVPVYGDTYLPFVTDLSASINGADWSIDILGMPGRLDLAKSAIDSSKVKYEDDDYGFDKEDYYDPTTYAVPFQKAPGFGITYKDYTVGLGFQYKDADGKENENIDIDDTTAVVHPLKYYAGVDFSAVAKTPEIDLNGFKIQGGASYYLNETASVKVVTDKNVEGKDTTKFSTNRGSAVGGSVAVGFEKDKFAIKVASDLGYTIEAYDASTGIIVKDPTKSEKFSLDVAGNIKYDFISADGYLKIDGSKWDDGEKKATLASGQLVTDLNSFDVPVKLTVKSKDVLNKADTSVEAEFAISDITLTPSVGYVFLGDDKTTLSVGLGAKYVADVFTVEGEVGYSLKCDTEDTHRLYATAAVSTDAIIPGCTLKLAYAQTDAEAGNMNWLKDQAKAQNFGKVTASAKIEF